MPRSETTGDDLASSRTRDRTPSRWVDLLSAPVTLLATVVAELKLSTVQRLGALLGTIWCWLLPIRRRVVRQNIAYALPELSARTRRQIAARCYRHVATTVLELFWLTGRPRPELDQVVVVTGLEHYERVREQRRGVVAVTAHLGNWDLLACSQALSGVPLSVVTKELSAQRLSRIWMEARERMGVKLLPSRGSILAVLRTLRRGEVIGLVVDQRTAADEGGAEVAFFGRPAMTTTAPHVLAARTGAAVLPVFSYRASDGVHHVEVGAEIETRSSAIATMTAINEAIEQAIRAHPEQWLWLHRRWKL